MRRTTPVRDPASELWEDATMWHRFAMILVLAVAAAVPAIAQPAGADQKLQQEIEAVFNAWLDAINRGDGKAANAFFAPNAPAINPTGLVHSGPEYTNRVEMRQENVRTNAKVDGVQAIGSDAAYAVGPWNSQQARGMWLQLYERRTDGWKISASSFTRVGGPQGNAGANAGANANAGAPRGGPGANPQADQARRQRP
jgi:ketosteroid isomerase-like protein